MKVDHLNGLRALEAVLRTGGLKQAASELGVTPAAIGQQIRNLEAYLETSLLDRSATTAVPTPAAIGVKHELTRHMRGFADVVSSLQDKGQPNHISVSVLPSWAEIWFPRHLASLFAKIPEIDLRIEGSTKRADLHSGQFDFAVRHIGEPPPAHDGRLLIEDYVAPVCTPDFAERYKLSESTKSLIGVPVAEIEISALGSTAELGDIFDWCREFSIEPPEAGPGIMMLKDATGQRMASAGLVIYLTALIDAIDEIQSGKLVLPLGSKISKRPYGFWLIWREEMRLNAVQKDFVDWMLDRAAQDMTAQSKYLAGIETVFCSNLF